MIILLLLLGALADVPASGAASPGSEDDRPVLSGLGAAGSAVGRGWTRPFQWDGKDWLVLGSAIGAGFASALLDDEVREVFLENRGKFGDAVQDVGFEYGKPQTQLAGGLALYVPGAVAGNAWLRDTGEMLLANVFVAGIPQQMLKVLVGRARPEAGLGNRRFDSLNPDYDYASFISGHTALAVGSSVVLSRQIGHPAATVPLAALALSTPLARLYDDAHWFSDTVTGALLGWFSGNFVCDVLGRRTGIASRISFLPDPRGPALRFRF